MNRYGHLKQLILSAKYSSSVAKSPIKRPLSLPINTYDYDAFLSEWPKRLTITNDI